MNPTRLALVIALVALVAPTLRYAVSFQAAEPALSVFGLRLEISAVTGLAIALSYEGAAFLGLHEAMKARERGRKHWWWPAAGAGVQVAVGAGIIVPVLVAELRETPLAVVLGPVVVWTWSAAVVVATPLSLATLALSLAVQPHARSKRAQRTRTTRVQSAQEEEEYFPDARMIVTDAHRAPYRICEACGYTAYSQQAWAGHCGGHAHKARAAAHKED